MGESVLGSYNTRRVDIENFSPEDFFWGADIANTGKQFIKIVASPKSFESLIIEAGFTHVFKDVDVPATESYVKEIDGIEIEIEFLTDSATRDDKNKNVVIAGIVAQPLSYLTLSLQTPMEFQTHSREKGKVVSQEHGSS